MKRKPPSNRIELYKKLCVQNKDKDATPFLIDVSAHGSVVTVCAPERSQELDQLGSAFAFLMPNALETNIRRRRDVRQDEIYRWVRETFGANNACTEERVLRLVEEVIELAQAEKVAPERLHKLITHVYSKPAGNPVQEAGGVGTTLLAYCAAKGVSADDVEAAEAARVLTIDPEYFRRRHNLKADAGVAAPVYVQTKEPAE